MTFGARAFWTWWCLGLAWITSVPVEAQTAAEAPGTMDAEGRLLFEAGRRAFEDGRFEDALARFREAHRLTQRPQLLYNVGRALDALRRDAEALSLFKAYLAALPEADNRREVEARIATLHGLLLEERSDRAAPDAAARLDGPSSPAATPADEATPAGTTRPAWAGALSLGGLAVALAGAIPAALAMSTRSSLDGLCAPDGACPEAARSLLTRGQLEAGAADVLFAAGGALALGFGLVWLLVEEPTQADVSAWCDPRGCGVAVRGPL
jgi:tetratricopeptide (TPR) repeat protein